MNIQFVKTLLVVFLSGITSILWGQEVSDTTRQGESTMAAQKKELPPIQLQEYTIVGLAKISLPHKVRTQTFHEVGITWSENEEIFVKEVPDISFQVARIKATLLQLYDFPWLDSHLHYGAYNTAGLNVKMQFKAQNTLPYLMANFQRSDGHLTNAQWTTAALLAGVHQKIGDIHLLHGYTDYSLNKKGIWGFHKRYSENWETLTTFWEIGGQVEDRWSDHWRTHFTGIYFFDEHENAFTYSENGYDLSGSAILTIENTNFALKGGIQTSDIEVSDGNLSHSLPDTLRYSGNRISLFSGQVNVQQHFHSVTAEIGVLYQQSEDKYTHTGTKPDENERFSPQISLSAGFQGRGKIYARYRPGLEIRRFRTALQLIPFSELEGIKSLNLTSRWEGGFDWHASSALNLQILSRYSEMKNYLAIVAPSDSLRAVFTGGGYPGWIYGILDRVKIQEVYVKLDWVMKSKLKMLSWLNWQQSDIRQADYFSPTILGNQIPYFPSISAHAELRWNFYRQHELKLWGDYVGSRYDDLENQVEVKSYGLVNTSLHLYLGKGFWFFISGQNLFDTRYQEFRGFTAPGITGIMGLRLTM